MSSKTHETERLPNGTLVAIVPEKHAKGKAKRQFVAGVTSTGQRWRKCFGRLCKGTWKECNLEHFERSQGWSDGFLGKCRACYQADREVRHGKSASSGAATKGRGRPPKRPQSVLAFASSASDAADVAGPARPEKKAMQTRPPLSAIVVPPPTESLSVVSSSSSSSSSSSDVVRASPPPMSPSSAKFRDTAPPSSTVLHVDADFAHDLAAIKREQEERAARIQQQKDEFDKREAEIKQIETLFAANERKCVELKERFAKIGDVERKQTELLEQKEAEMTKLQQEIDARLVVEEKRYEEVKKAVEQHRARVAQATSNIETTTNAILSMQEELKQLTTRAESQAARERELAAEKARQSEVLRSLRARYQASAAASPIPYSSISYFPRNSPVRPSPSPMPSASP